ncbi:MAG: hypothetical protein EXR72_19925 [Myxococcales bacterium]|nr:hypothetical protein [Myxococcales bacterium]
MRRPLAWFALAVAAATGCGPPPRVQFTPPTVAPRSADYPAIQDRWTRHAHVTREFDTAVDVYATLQTSEFRAAWLARVATLRQLAGAARSELEQEQARDAEQFVDCVLQVHTGRWNWNDLTSPRSLWTITLVDDRGREAGPALVHQVPLKPDEVAALYPGGTPFTRTWRVRFRRTLPDQSRLLDPATRWVLLRIAGPLGNTGDQLRWDARPADGLRP